MFHEVSEHSVILRKSRDQDPLLFSGTKVVEGTAKILIVAVGKHVQVVAGRPVVKENNKEK